MLTYKQDIGKIATGCLIMGLIIIPIILITIKIYWKPSQHGTRKGYSKSQWLSDQKMLLSSRTSSTTFEPTQMVNQSITNTSILPFHKTDTIGTGTFRRRTIGEDIVAPKRVANKSQPKKSDIEKGLLLGQKPFSSTPAWSNDYNELTDTNQGGFRDGLARKLRSAFAQCTPGAILQYLEAKKGDKGEGYFGPKINAAMSTGNATVWHETLAWNDELERRHMDTKLPRAPPSVYYPPDENFWVT